MFHLCDIVITVIASGGKKICKSFLISREWRQTVTFAVIRLFKSHRLFSSGLLLGKKISQWYFVNYVIARIMSACKLVILHAPENLNCESFYNYHYVDTFLSIHERWSIHLNTSIKFTLFLPFFKFPLHFFSVSNFHYIPFILQMLLLHTFFFFFN